MRVLLLAQTFAPVIGGEERHVENLAKALAGRGHEIHVATQALDGRTESVRDPRHFELHRLASLSAKLPVLHADPMRPQPFPVPDPQLARELQALVTKVQPDLVHAHNGIVNTYLAVHRRRIRPLVMSLHSYSHRCAQTRYLCNNEICSGPGLNKCLACSSRSYGRTRGTVVLTGTWLMKPWRERAVDLFLPVSTAVAKGTGLDKCGTPYEVVPNFVPEALLHSEPVDRRPECLPDREYLLFVGDLSGDKGLAAILKAYEGVKAPKPLLLAVGRKTETTPSRLPDGVVIGEEWRHEDVVAAFRHALCAVLPSECADACPTTVLEAMALGAPLITTPVGGITDMVDQGSALMVAPGDSGDIQRAMTQMIEDPKLRASLAAAAAERVPRFTDAAVVPRIEHVYKDLVERHGSRGRAIGEGQ